MGRSKPLVSTGGFLLVVLLKIVMSRLVALLLIPLCLLGQAMPHSHAGSRSGEPEDHGDRPHVHLGHHHGHSHECDHRHHHDDEECPAGNRVCSGTDHDSDAVYLGDFLASVSLKTVSAPAAASIVAALWSTCVPVVPAVTVCRYLAAPPDPSGGLPVYLRTTSLRI